MHPQSRHLRIDDLHDMIRMHQPTPPVMFMCQPPRLRLRDERHSPLSQSGCGMDWQAPSQYLGAEVLSAILLGMSPIASPKVESHHFIGQSRCAAPDGPRTLLAVAG